ncbi:MAG: helix-turn-helix domain-containing protein [Firmicutes bacterium]|nr:helix-turn-helix domain-containing protein [Bacillota bacterium]
MSLQNTILDIRKNSGLTQEEFAERLFVTRQAVSRWENGETTPTIETLKAISELFKVDANILLGTENSVCQSCAMPLKKVEDLGTGADGGANTEYCTYCFQNGNYTHDRTMDEMIETNLKFLAEYNAGNGTAFSEAETRSILKVHLATLKRWKTKE